MRGQCAVIPGCRSILAPQQIQIAAGVKRLGQPLTLREAGLQLCHDALLFVQITAIPRQFHQQVQPPSAVLILRVGQCFSLGLGEPLQLKVAGRGGHGKARAALCVEIRLPRQRMVLRARVGVMAGVVVGIAQAAQFGRGQAGLRAHFS